MTFGEALAAMVTALAVANLERTGVTYEVLVGDEHLEANGAPPRIVIVPLGAQPVGARLQAGGGPRAIAGENHAFVAQLWAKGANSDTTTKGKDYVACSTMKATFTAAMRATFGTNFQLMEGQWTSVDGKSMSEDGRQYAQHFTLSALSLDTTPTDATVTTTTLNIGISNPGVDFVNP